MKTLTKNAGIVAALTIGLFITSCKKEDVSNVTGKGFNGSIDSATLKAKKVADPVSNVRLVNASSDAGAASLYIAGDKDNKGKVNFGQVSDYAHATPSVPREPVYIIAKGDTLVKNSSGFYQDNYYSVYLTGRKADGNIGMIISRDDMTAPSAGNASIKFVNAATNSGYLNVLYGNTVLFGGQQYSVTTKYKELPAGNYVFSIAVFGAANPSVTLPPMKLESGKIYTIYTQNMTIKGKTSLDANIVASN